jgi:amphi-Trp domain-containing protein
MKIQRNMSRWALARRLQAVSLRIAAGKPIRIGGVSVRVPDRVILDEEVETQKGRTELEFELKWPVTGPRSVEKQRKASLRLGKGRSTP